METLLRNEVSLTRGVPIEMIRQGLHRSFLQNKTKDIVHFVSLSARWMRSVGVVGVIDLTLGFCIALVLGFAPTFHQWVSKGNIVDQVRSFRLGFAWLCGGGGLLWGLVLMWGGGTYFWKRVSIVIDFKNKVIPLLLVITHITKRHNFRQFWFGFGPSVFSLRFPNLTPCSLVPDSSLFFRVYPEPSPFAQLSIFLPSTSVENAKH